MADTDEERDQAAFDERIRARILSGEFDAAVLERARTLEVEAFERDHPHTGGT